MEQRSFYFFCSALPFSLYLLCLSVCLSVCFSVAPFVYLCNITRQSAVDKPHLHQVSRLAADESVRDAARGFMVHGPDGGSRPTNDGLQAAGRRPQFAEWSQVVKADVSTQLIKAPPASDKLPTFSLFFTFL